MGATAQDSLQHPQQPEEACWELRLLAECGLYERLLQGSALLFDVKLGKIVTVQLLQLLGQVRWVHERVQR